MGGRDRTGIPNATNLRVPVLRELLRPIGQIAIFVSATGAILSVAVVLLALILRGSGVDQAAVENAGSDLMTYTLINLPQVLIDGVTIGFVYAAIALGYTMVYGVLEFINFAHSEVFAIGAFVGVELLIAFNNAGWLAGLSNWAAFGVLLVAILAGMVASGSVAVIMERTAYRPLRNSPRLVPLISAIGVSFFLQDAIRFVESITTGQFYRIIPTFGNFDQRFILSKLSFSGATVELGISVKSVIVIVVAVLMLMFLNYLVNATKLGKAIRAVAQDQPSSSLMGINVNRIIAFTFLIGGALGGRPAFYMH